MTETTPQGFAEPSLALPPFNRALAAPRISLAELERRAISIWTEQVRKRAKGTASILTAGDALSGGEAPTVWLHAMWTKEVCYVAMFDAVKGSLLVAFTMPLPNFLAPRGLGDVAKSKWIFLAGALLLLAALWWFSALTAWKVFFLILYIVGLVLDILSELKSRVPPGTPPPPGTPAPPAEPSRIEKIRGRLGALEEEARRRRALGEALRRGDWEIVERLIKEAEEALQEERRNGNVPPEEEERLRRALERARGAMPHD